MGIIIFILFVGVVFFFGVVWCGWHIWRKLEEATKNIRPRLKARGKIETKKKVDDAIRKAKKKLNETALEWAEKYSTCKKCGESVAIDMFAALTKNLTENMPSKCTCRHCTHEFYCNVTELPVFGDQVFVRTNAKAEGYKYFPEYDLILEHVAVNNWEDHEGIVLFTLPNDRENKTSFTYTTLPNFLFIDNNFKAKITTEYNAEDKQLYDTSGEESISGTKTETIQTFETPEDKNKGEYW